MNQLKKLPPLPEELKHLDVYQNQLTELPPLPSQIKSLYLENNCLTKLPILPQGLKVLYIAQNQIEDIPNLPSSLIEIHCKNNKIQCLSLYDNPNLEYLRCANNKMELISQQDIQTLMPLKRWYYTMKYGRKLERMVSKKRNRKFFEEFQHVLYSPDYPFYKRFCPNLFVCQ
jgi:Leucine-rich repeat (LRR) protein